MTFWDFVASKTDGDGLIFAGLVIGLPLAVGVGALVWHVFDVTMKLAACHL